VIGQQRFDSAGRSNQDRTVNIPRGYGPRDMPICCSA